MRSGLIAALLTGIVTVRGATQGAAKIPLPLERYSSFENVADPRVSPDGSHIIYRREWINRALDRLESAQWIMRADGSDRRELLRGAVDPTWSPDGARVAYVAPDTTGYPQIFVLGLANGSRTQVTRVDRAPGNVTWSPDGTALAFTMFVDRPPNRSWDIALPPRPPGATWVEDPIIVERLVFRMDGVLQADRGGGGFLPDGRFQLFLVPALGGSPRQLTHEDRDQGGGAGLGGNLSWTPDGREIVYADWDLQTWEYPWRTSEVRAIRVADGSIRTLTHRDGPDYNPEASPDGRSVAYMGYDRSSDSYVRSNLYVVGIDGTGARVLTANLEGSLESYPYGMAPRQFWWAGDGSGLYASILDRGTRNLVFVPLHGEPRAVTRGNQLFNVSSISRTGRAAGTLTSFYQPPDIAVFDPGMTGPSRLTAVNDSLLRDVQLGTVEEIWYPSGKGGTRVQGWVIKPPGFDPSRRYPLVLVIHGGPHWAYDVGFDFAFQHHAAAGYVVLYTNPRGSTGYGAAFANAINHAFPGPDADDLLAGVDTVVGRGFVDPKRLFVYGCSGGGTLAAWLVGHTDRFAAAAANCPVVEWTSFVGTTDGISFSWNFAKLPGADPSEHWARSPLAYADRVKTPTLIMNGENDLNTPIGQAEQFYRALRLRGVPTALIRFHEEAHGTTTRPSNFLRTQLYLYNWFRRYGGA